MTRLVLPLPPSVNHAYRNFTTRDQRRMRVPTNASAQFKREAATIAMVWRSQNRWRMPSPDTKIIVRIWVYWKNKQRRDTDNVFKLTLDSLTGVLYEDDNMCLPRVMNFDVDRGNPRIELELEEWRDVVASDS